MGLLRVILFLGLLYAAWQFLDRWKAERERKMQGKKRDPNLKVKRKPETKKGFQGGEYIDFEEE